MLEDKLPLKVFLCHASQDKPFVREIYDALKLEGWIDPWLDKAKILPGQDWRTVIEIAVEEADVVIICLSNQSVGKEGFVQKEIRYAYDIALEKPEETIFLIPLRLDECVIPRRLRSLHWVDYFGVEKNNAYSSLLDALKLRHEQKLRIDGGERARQEKERQEHKVAEKNAREKEEREIAEKAIGENTKSVHTVKPVQEKVKREARISRQIIIALISLVGIICLVSIGSLLMTANLLRPANLRSPTSDTNPVFTAAALTVQAQLTQSAPFRTPTLPHPQSTNITISPLATVCDQARFIKDVTIPDGTTVVPGALFTKTWRIRNDGSCLWSGYSLVFDSGDEMSNTLSILIESVNPGQEVDISVMLTAPSTSGTYRGYWRIRNRSGVFLPILNGTLGKAIFVDIKVVE